MKYIVFMDNTAVLLPQSASHHWVAGDKIVKSAGFCRIETYRNHFDDVRAKVFVWGESNTLGVKSDPQDAQIIEMMFI